MLKLQTFYFLVQITDLFLFHTLMEGKHNGFVQIIITIVRRLRKFLFVENYERKLIE